MTDQPPKPRRRWFQFSLHTLLIAVALAAGLLVGRRREFVNSPNGTDQREYNDRIVRA